VAARLRWTLGAAVLVHVAAAAWASRARSGVVAVRPPQATEKDVEVSLLEEPTEPHAEREPEPRVPELAAARSTDRATARATAHATREVAAADGVAVSSTSREHATEQPLEPPRAREDGGWSFPSGAASAPSAGPLAGRSVAAAARDAARATLEQERAERPPPTRQVLPPFGPRDVELGLAPGGALVTLARDLVRRSRAPETSHATLQLDTDATGVVTAARVLDASSGRAAWDEVAGEIATAARAKPPLRVPAGAHGLAVTIELASRLSEAKPRGALAGALGVVNDPLGVAAREAPQRVVSAKMTDVAVF
jgi:hypothetical protein